MGRSALIRGSIGKGSKKSPRLLSARVRAKASKDTAEPQLCDWIACN
jgi:hypothetical protein